MTRDRDASFVRQPGLFVRLLSFALLGLIFYGTTVEAAHKHNNLVEPAASARGAALSDDETDGDVANRISGCADCLICQLQQSFSGEAVALRQFGPLKLQRIALSVAVPSTFSSPFDAPQSDRAPPSIS